MNATSTYYLYGTLQLHLVVASLLLLLLLLLLHESITLQTKYTK